MAAAVDAVLPSRFREDQAPGGVSRVVIVGSHIFNLKLAKLLEHESGFEVVATADTAREAMAAPNEHGAELTIIEVDFGGAAQGTVLARSIAERSQGCAIMLVCGTFTSSVAKHLWVYGVDSWSIISSATAQSPTHVSEAVSSAVHGKTWVEPGIKRAMAAYGPRLKSVNERKLTMFDDQAQSQAV